MDHSPPGSSVHEISQARILEWVAMSFSKGSSQPLGSNPHLQHWQVDSLPLSHQGSQESENQTLGFITSEVALEKAYLGCDYHGAFCIPSLSSSKPSGGHNWACRVDQLRITASQCGARAATLASTQHTPSTTTGKQEWKWKQPSCKMNSKRPMWLSLLIHKCLHMEKVELWRLGCHHSPLQSAYVQQGSEHRMKSVQRGQWKFPSIPRGLFPHPTGHDHQSEVKCGCLFRVRVQAASPSFRASPSTNHSPTMYPPGVIGGESPQPPHYQKALKRGSLILQPTPKPSWPIAWKSTSGLFYFNLKFCPSSWDPKQPTGFKQWDETTARRYSEDIIPSFNVSTFYHKRPGESVKSKSEGFSASWLKWDGKSWSPHCSPPFLLILFSLSPKRFIQMPRGSQGSLNCHLCHLSLELVAIR